MTEIWIHRKCARPATEAGKGDELLLPKQPDKEGIEVCVICRTHTPTLGTCYLHKGEAVNWTAPVEAVEVTEGDSEEVAESIPDSIEKGLDIVKELIDEGKAVLEADSEEPSEDTETSAEAESEQSVVIAVKVDAEKAKATLDELDAQITELKAKKEALEE